MKTNTITLFYCDEGSILKEFGVQMLRRLLIKIFKISDQQGASLPNLITKKIISLMGGGVDGTFFKLLKKFYRITGSRIKINKSYSFNGEDLILARYLTESNGSYLDIGCGNPIKGNNTFFLYKRGWKGHCIDPIPKLIRRHQIFRPRDFQYLGVVAERENQCTFYEFDSNDFSTTSHSRFEELVDKGVKLRKIRTPKVFEISSLNIRVKPQEPFLLDVDVEGTEMEVMSTINWKEFTPRVIAVEEWESPIYEATSLRTFLESLNYRLVGRAFVTSIYVHTTYLNSN